MIYINLYKTYQNLPIIIFLLSIILIISVELISVKYENKIIKQQIVTKNCTIEKLLNRLNQENKTTQIVTLTAYHPDSKGINSDKDPKKTATMKKPKPGYTLAISTELFKLGWLGKKIYIDGWGVGLASDRMAKKVKGKKIDICVNSLKSAKTFGIKKNITASVLN